MLLCLDFEKVFDSLDWRFMFKALRAFGFGKDHEDGEILFIKHKVNRNGEWTDNSVVYNRAWMPT